MSRTKNFKRQNTFFFFFFAIYLPRREIWTSCRNWVDPKRGGSRLWKRNRRGRRNKKPQTENHPDEAPGTSRRSTKRAPERRPCAVRPRAVVPGSGHQGRQPRRAVPLRLAHCCSQRRWGEEWKAGVFTKPALWTRWHRVQAGSPCSEL